MNYKVMTTVEKEKICISTAELVEKMGSQAKAANKLRISTANMSHIMNRKNLESISDEMWRKLRLSLGMTDEWMTAPTRSAKTLEFYLELCRDFAAVHGIINHAGSGKSYVTEQFAKMNTGSVFLVQCDEFWSQKDFLEQLLTSLGKASGGLNKRELMNTICETISGCETPLIIIDEADKLNDKVLQFFITLYNRLEDYCGIVLIATDYLEKRIKRGVSRNKQGYNEIFSRLGRNFISLPAVNDADVRMVCQANGLTDTEVQESIIKRADSDLRRAKKLINAEKMKSAERSAE